MRTTLEKGHVLKLLSRDGSEKEYIIDRLVSEAGSSCLCYAAHIKDKATTYILKEFYPKSAKACRTDEGSLVFENVDIIQRGKVRFEQSVVIMRKLAESNQYRRFVVEDVELLRGNGTVYCLNADYTGGKTWEVVKSEEEDIVQVLSCLKNIAEFLNHLHLEGYSYVDLKPDNILLRGNFGHLDYEEPVFLDFDSVMESGEYLLKDVHSTLRYAPPVFKGTNYEKVVLVNEKTDMYSFGQILEEKVTKEMKEKMDRSSLSLLEECMTKFQSRKNGFESFKEIADEIDHIITCYNEPIKKMCSMSYEDSKKKFDILFKVVLVSSLFMCFELAAAYLLLSFGVDSKIAMILRDNYMMMITIVAILVTMNVFLLLMKAGLNYIGWQMQNSKVAAESLAEGICNSDISTYMRGTRKEAALLDETEVTAFRKKERYTGWGLLAAAILIGLLFSIHKQAFPFFFIIGLLSIAVFMICECALAYKKFYKASVRGSVLLKNKSYADNKGIYYINEYEASNSSFQLEDDFYSKSGLDLYKTKNWIKRLTTTTGYENDVIRQTYKMTFNRIRDRQAIVDLSVLALSLLVLFLNLAVFSGVGMKYLYFPPSFYYLITIVSVVTNFIATCVQIIYTKKREALAADMAFASRYLIASKLDHRFKEDIINGIIIRVDIARGIFQYNASEYSIGRKSIPWKNKFLLHHVDMENDRRLAITVWLSFGAVFSYFVWYQGRGILFPVILIGTVVVHLICYKWILPEIHRFETKIRVKRMKKKIGI